jgi:CRP-like cAMP-binding protein
VHFQKGDTVLHENEHNSNIYLLLAGVTRGYYIDEDGNDITKCFCMENNVFGSEWLRTKKSSSFNIECLEYCECLKISYNLVTNLMEKNSQISEAINHVLQQEFVKLESRINDLVMKSAEERYDDFCKEFPELHNRVPLKYIASYIGIREPSLSRIRKNRK